MIWIPITITVLYAMSLGINMGEVGKPRKPTTSGLFLAQLVLNLALIAAIWYLYAT